MVEPWNQSKAEQLSSAIADHIGEQRYQPGHRLGTKQELAAAYGVSPNTLNEALRLARAAGVVAVRTGPGGGVFVAKPSPLVRVGHKMLSLTGDSDAVADCIRIRHALEPLVTEQATLHATPRDVADLHEVVDRMEASVTDDLEFLRANLDLHRRIARIGPGEMIEELYVGIVEFIDAHTNAVVPDQDYADEAPLRVEVHRELVRAIGSGDLEAARVAEHRHRRIAEDDRSTDPTDSSALR